MTEKFGKLSEKADVTFTNKDEQIWKAMSDLSLKIQRIESKLREFEKQRVIPINERIDNVEFIIDEWFKFFPTFYEKLNEEFGDVLDRLSALETSEDKDFSMESRKCDHDWKTVKLKTRIQEFYVNKCTKCGETHERE